MLQKQRKMTEIENIDLPFVMPIHNDSMIYERGSRILLQISKRTSLSIQKTESAFSISWCMERVALEKKNNNKY